jgi:hypothetical protein
VQVFDALEMVLIVIWVLMSYSFEPNSSHLYIFIFPSYLWPYTQLFEDDLLFVSLCRNDDDSGDTNNDCNVHRSHFVTS